MAYREGNVAAPIRRPDPQGAEQGSTTADAGRGPRGIQGADRNPRQERVAQRWEINSDEVWRNFVERVTQMRLAGLRPTVELTQTVRPRTVTQNASLHKFLELLAETLNDAGLDMKRVIREEVDIPWTKDSAKQYLWRPIQKAIIGKASTAEAETPDYDKVHKVLSRHLGDKFGVDVPAWPSLR